MPRDQWIDRLAVGLAGGLSRRELLRRVGIGTAAVALASVAPWPTLVQAQDGCSLEDGDLVCPPDMLVDLGCGDNSIEVSYPFPTLPESCSEVLVTCSPPSGTFGRGTHPVECIAIDPNGQLVTCTFNVQVKRKCREEDDKKHNVKKDA
jgi:hypothetical protein